MTITNPIHKKILRELKEVNPKRDKEERLWVQKYLGSNKLTLGTKGTDVVKIARSTVHENKIDIKEFARLLDSLYSKATIFQEIEIAGRLLGIAPKIRQGISPTKLDYWLSFTHGWAEVDILCQSNFTPEEILKNWKAWKKLLEKFSKDKNIHKRRASLVLLTKAVRTSNDKRLSDLAFKNTEKLKHEKEILITKAVSWILRSLIKNHKKEVENYLNKNKETLPKIAVREVSNKLKSGRKSGK